ncbi:Tim17/Tim22/Tim23/Pmp24 family-domain-containing protein [Polychytrium aggregatum]|uniref:Tim17/Tim22/Tim23/Pmp24 family-domain-containing protein n=1 Tax=Polychytrium aggregatum TaxID=110093 RepID=UPI0022FDE91D|nr:Tim17/Tim22/Tim23/Pmp24 family-domain-containing protein [Polychytrium aggregatum]KAI9205020.1 Tim17/Tim22/Tim23/Pmp24 family-domain-containing protein [Polychytrium aggregatum]
MEGLQHLVSHADGVIASQQYQDLLSIVKGFRNGAVYGAKIRFPHALVMTLLFRKGSLSEKAKFILRATYQHSRNLAFFVAIYKSLMLVLRKVRGGQEHHLDSFVAGLFGSMFIFGEDNPINQQINLYVFSRVVLGFAKLITVKKKWITAPSQSFRIFAVVTWGCVMWLFRHHRETLQGSLQDSMQYLYNDSDIFDNVINWIVYNK